MMWHVYNFIWDKSYLLLTKVDEAGCKKTASATHKKKPFPNNTPSLSSQTPWFGHHTNLSMRRDVFTNSSLRLLKLITVIIYLFFFFLQARIFFSSLVCRKKKKIKLKKRLFPAVVILLIHTIY